VTSLVYRSAAGYELLMRLLYGRHYGARMRAVADQVPDGASVLELCCGPGTLYLRHLRGRTRGYVGVDVNPRFVTRLRRRGVDARRLDLAHDTATDALPSADVVILQASLYHFLPKAPPSGAAHSFQDAERIVERSEGPLRSDYASYGNDIAAAARHLLSVLTTMNEGPAQGHGSIDLAAVAAEAVVLVDSTAQERGVTIEIEASNALPAQAEERAVTQIIVNLLSNAIRHSPAAGRIRLTFARTEGTTSVSISDEGPGIAAADQQRIFERFERANPKEGGTGLGLAISRRLARSMGGDVTLDSAPGEGARFTLTLPAA